MALVSINTAGHRETGKGMRITWGVADSPFGKCLMAQTPRGVSHLSFFDGDETESLEAVRKDWPMAELARDDKPAGDLSAGIFRNTATTIPLLLKGTPFQLLVWEALIGIPRPELSTYGSLAETIGHPGSSRAVGNAVGANRISYLVPCHRVIRADGRLGGYRWGAERKRAMLAAERGE